MGEHGLCSSHCCLSQSLDQYLTSFVLCTYVSKHNFEPKEGVLWMELPDFHLE